MPARSNDFQRLVKAIEAATAVAGATVTESAMVENVHGEEREIDILITAPLGTRTIRIAVECRDHKRKSTVEWVEQLTTKYANLRVDRVVVVNRKGFSRQAQRQGQ